MRVIAGEYRRRTLVTPPGMATRPTSDRLRQTLFDVLAPRLAEARFLDLYAGSGANGIEALSRGAAHVVFVEQAPPALAAIRANLAALSIPSAAAIVQSGPVLLWLRSRAADSSAPPFNIVFLDPPYDQQSEYAGTLDLLGCAPQGLLAPGAVVVAEHRRARGAAQAQAREQEHEQQGAPRTRHGVLLRTRLLEQGDGALSFYAATGPEHAV